MDVDELFDGRRVPAWFRSFAEAPQTAVGDLLVGCADLGLLSAGEPTQVLLDWLETYGDREGFAEAADKALADWVSTSWGIPELPAAAGSAVLTAVAWCRCANVIAVDRRLTNAASELCERVKERRQFLDTLNFGRARDPLGRAWFALAWHQRDRSLLHDWWRLCSLPLDEPWYRGHYGIYGLRGLPAATGEDGGMWCGEVAAGLVKLGRALVSRARNGWLDEGAAKQEFQSVARLTMGAYPFPDVWQDFWAPLRDDRDEVFAGWVAPLASGAPRARRGAGPRKSDPRWADVAERIAGRLAQRDATAVEEAEALLDAQARYAEATGDTMFVVKSACYFASTAAEWLPEEALAWAQEARHYEPWNPYGWTTALKCLLKMGRPGDARSLGLATVNRFPDDVVARTSLAEALRAVGRLVQAEGLYAETLELFPRNEYARNGLAAVRRELEGQTADDLDTPLDDGNQPLEVQPSASGEDLRSEDIEVLLADAHLLRRWGRGTGHIGPTDAMRAEARRVLEGLQAFTGSDPRAIAERGLLMLTTDDLEDALAVLRDAHSGPFSQSTRVSYALARVERELARHGSIPAEDALRQELSLWRAIERSSLPLRPLALLGEARAHHARNGTGDEGALQDALGSLGRWASRTVERAEGESRPEDKFPSWWAGHVLRLVYDGKRISSADELGDLAPYRKRLDDRADELDAREDEYLYRHART